MGGTTLSYLILGDAETDALGEYVATECDECGFDAVVTWPLTWLSANGVSTGGRLRICVRCHDDDDGDD